MASTLRSHARLVVPLAACLGAVVLISLQADGGSVVDGALPLYALAATAVAFLEGRRFGDATLALAIPVLGVVRVTLPDENLRALLYGAVLAVAVVLFVSRVLVRFGKLSTAETLLLTGLCAAVMKLVPWDPRLLAAQMAVLAGSAALVLAVSGRGGVRAGAAVACFAVVFATPLEPVRASLFPLVLAAVIAFLRGPSPFSVAAAGVVALLAGRWSWPMVGLAFAAAVVGELLEGARERRAAPSGAMAGVVPPFASASMSGALAVLAFSPESWVRVTRVASSARIAALGLVAAGFVLRPSLGVLYTLAALAIVLTGEAAGQGGDESERTPPLVAALFTALMLALAGFSGAVVSKFPLPLDLSGVAVVAAVALTATLARRAPRIAVATASVVLVAAVAVIVTAPRGTRIEAGAALAQGEAYETDLPPAARLRVELSGGNLTALAPGTPVGRVELFGPDGRVTWRDVSIGDLADWGHGRPGHNFASRNAWAPASGAIVADYGHEAFLGGEGTVTIASGDAARIRITAAPTLPGNGRLNVVGIEAVAR